MAVINIGAAKEIMTGVNNFMILQNAGDMSEAVFKGAVPVYFVDKDVLNIGSTASKKFGLKSTLRQRGRSRKGAKK